MGINNLPKVIHTAMPILFDVEHSYKYSSVQM